MSSIGINLTRRPLRVGWCVNAGDLVQLRAALRFTSLLWGGRWNPIIPVGEKSAARLASFFCVDVLYPITDDQAIDEFVGQHDHIRWPALAGSLIRGKEWYGYDRETIGLVDVTEAIRAAQKSPQQDSSLLGDPIFPDWSDTDPLANSLLATFGGYPRSSIGERFGSEFAFAAGGPRPELEVDSPLPISLLTTPSPLDFTQHGLHMAGGIHRQGLFIGDSASFSDIVDYWNLNAIGNELLFFDEKYSDRVRDLAQRAIGNLEGLDERFGEDWRHRLSIFSRTCTGLPLCLTSKVGVAVCSTDATLPGEPNAFATLVETDTDVTVADVSTHSRPTLTFQLPTPKYFSDGNPDDQMYVVTARPYSIGLEERGFTFFAPNIPTLNPYFGREMMHNPDRVRATPDGIAIITDTRRRYETIQAISVDGLIRELFALSGLTVKPSRAGLIAKRLIRQMGGLQHCRAFKIAGVRRLISAYNPMQSFTHAQALKALGPGIESHDDLYLTGNSVRNIGPNGVFLVLVESGVFRAGLAFECPACQLDFWLSLDEAATTIECQFCGASFNATAQLRDERGDRGGWRYRRSGLFGRDNHQEGGIPVSLVLQRLEVSVSHIGAMSIYSTGLGGC